MERYNNGHIYTCILKSHFFLVSTVLVITLVAGNTGQDGASASLNDREQWNRFKARHGKTYQNAADENSRYGIWLKKMQIIESHNSLQHGNLETVSGKRSGQGYTLRDNHLADWTDAEYKKIKGFHSTLGGRKGKFPLIPDFVIPDSKYQPYINTVPVSQLPAFVNWTAQGFVNPVEDQGTCGDCWAFSAAGALEGQYYNATKTSALVSKQNLLDCSSISKYGNLGCDGGSMIGAFQYVIDNKGVDAYINYPYTGQLSNCRYESTQSLGYITGFRVVKAYSEEALQQAVALIGPVSVGINANLPSFQLYSSGVYNPPLSTCPGDSLDHAVLAVGYGTTSDGVDYWLLKNSWGTDWGINGYMMLLRNAGNLCGIATDASFPTNFVPSGIHIQDQGSMGDDATRLAPSALARGPLLLVITAIYFLLTSFF